MDPKPTAPQLAVSSDGLGLPTSVIDAVLPSPQGRGGAGAGKWYWKPDVERWYGGSDSGAVPAEEGNEYADGV